MIIGTEIFLDIDEFEQLISSSSLLTNSQLSELANRTVLFIIERTRMGRDAFGQKFQPYSESYALDRYLQGLSQRVDLSYNAEMLGSLVGGFEGDSALVYFSNQTMAKIADYHTSSQPRRKVPRRNFLDVDENGKEHDILANMAANFIAERLNS